jgi:uncharacterized protein
VIVVRAVVDHNVWVSSLLNPESAAAKVLEAYINGRFRSVTSMELLDELAEVMMKPKLFRYGFTLERARRFRALQMERAHITTPSLTVRVCRDKDDDLVLDVAVSGKADLITSKDSDLHEDQNVLTFLSEASIGLMYPGPFVRYLDDRVEA